MLFPTPILILTRERPPRPIFEVAEICGVVRVSNWLEFLHTLLVITRLGLHPHRVDRLAHVMHCD